LRVDIEIKKVDRSLANLRTINIVKAFYLGPLFLLHENLLFPGPKPVSCCLLQLLMSSSLLWSILGQAI